MCGDVHEGSELVVGTPYPTTRCSSAQSCIARSPDAIGTPTRATTSPQRSLISYGTCVAW